MADIRSLMKQKAAAKRITHSYARYSNAGQLTCTICGVPVKSEVVWPAHLTSKVHRNNVRRERAEQERQQQQQQSSSAQDHQDDDVDVDIPPDRKRAANDDGEEDGSTTAKRVRFSQDEEEESTVQDSNNALPPGFFDDPSAEAQASQASVNAGDVDDDEEWAAFEATLAAPDQPEASTSALNPFAAGATISAEEVLYEEKDDAQNNANGDADAAEEEEEEPQETEEQRKDREEREELMERIETEEREQQEADERVNALKKRMQNLRGSKPPRGDPSSAKAGSNGDADTKSTSAASRKRRVRGFGLS